MEQKVKSTILSALSNALFNALLAAIDDVDWHSVTRESVAHAVTALAYEAAKKALDKAGQTLPPDVDAEWQNAVNAVFRRNIRVEAEHAELHRLFSGKAPSPACGEGGLSAESTEGRGDVLPRSFAPRNDGETVETKEIPRQARDDSPIPYVILKGCASAMYYPDPFMRTLGDVDFLVRPEDADRADKLLCENGFTYKPSSNTDERVYVRGKSVWELHTAANGTPGGEVGKRVRALMSDAIEKAKPVSYVGVGFHPDPNVVCSYTPQAAVFRECASSPIEKKTVFPGQARKLNTDALNEGHPSTEGGGGTPPLRNAPGSVPMQNKPAVNLLRVQEPRFAVPSEFHHGLVLLLHTARHMTTGGVGLRQICDWAVFVAHMGERFPMVFEEKLRSVGLWKFACILTQLSSEYLGAPVQKWAGEPDRELLDALMDDIFAGGNFGIKDKTRRDQAKFITDRKSGGAASRTVAGQAVRSANEIVRRHWPIAAKLPVLYPAGWLFFGGRYVLRAALGRRSRINVRELAKRAEERRKVYEKLDLFI